MSVPKGYELERDKDGLTHREREVLVAYLQGKTMEAIGKEVGLTKQRVSSIVSAAAKKGAVIESDGRKFVRRFVRS